MSVKSPNEVVIAGAGIAAGFVAIRAAQLGFKPTLLRTPAPRQVKGVEIIPASAAALLETLGLGAALADLGVGLSEGMTRRFANGHIEHVPGRALHIERLKLRAMVLDEAQHRGARVLDLNELPAPPPGAFSVDATGQRAAWSRPLRRVGRDAADIFSGDVRQEPVEGRIAFLDRSWTYLAADAATMTVGVVGRLGRRSPCPGADALAALGLAPDTPLKFEGRRPAFLQWSTSVEGWRLAVGDAAVHHNPIGGRGISFALGTAFAAVAVFATWRDAPARAELARNYYKDYVAAEVRRHRAFLTGDEEHTLAPVASPERLYWTGEAMPAALCVDSRIVDGSAFRAPSGNAIRWAGGFDLKRLEELTGDGERRDGLEARLENEGLTRAEARQAITWALAVGLLGPAP